MVTRRDVLRRGGWLGAGLAGLPLFAACGQELGPLGGTRAAEADVARSEGDPAAAPDASAALRAFTADLHRRLAGTPGNVVFSPYSVAVALAMTRNGARGRTAEQMDAVLHAPALDRFNGGMNALTRLVESRAGKVRRADRSRATIRLDVANSLWGQADTPWERRFLEALKRDYDAGMRQVDYKADPERARRSINAWTADRTADKIPQLLATGTLDTMTRLVLVNAIYLKAPWESPFAQGLTRPLPFRAGGGTVQADGMSGAEGRIGYATGPGWRAARLPYAGGHLAMTVVLPDEPTPLASERSLDGPALDRMLAPFPTDTAVDVVLPKWRFRLATPLNEHLEALGMRDAFSARDADLTGMTVAERLYISLVQHEAFVAVDEQGTEAAAATAVVARAVSAGPTPVPFVVDRPFLFLIHDVEARAPLFVGRVDDPTRE